MKRCVRCLYPEFKPDLHFDADGQFDVADLIPALNTLQQKGADMLVGSRMLDSRSNLPWFKSRILFPLRRTAPTATRSA